MIGFRVGQGHIEPSASQSVYALERGGLRPPFTPPNSQPLVAHLENQKMKEIRTKKITVRYTEDELKRANEKAVGALASWLRDLSLEQADKRKPKPVNPELLFHLNKIGVNLNQIARYCNRQEIFEGTDKIDLLFVLAAIDDQLKELRQKYDS